VGEYTRRLREALVRALDVREVLRERGGKEREREGGRKRERGRDLCLFLYSRP